jgi:hypothetical protein
MIFAHSSNEFYIALAGLMHYLLNNAYEDII